MLDEGDRGILVAPVHGTAALWAFTGGPLQPELRHQIERALIDRFERYVQAPPNHWFDAPKWLVVAAGLDIAETRPLLGRIAGMHTAASPLAAAILLPALSRDQASQLSGAIAAAGIVPDSDRCDDHHLRILVEANPDAWLALVKNSLEHAGHWGFTAVIRLLPHLPDRHQRELASVLRDLAEDQDLPWSKISGWTGPMVYARPSDVVARVLFDAGLPATAPIAS